MEQSQIEMIQTDLKQDNHGTVFANYLIMNIQDLDKSIMIVIGKKLMRLRQVATLVLILPACLAACAEVRIQLMVIAKTIK